MFNKFELFVGLRYLRIKQKNSFVSFISLVSIIGITLGVSALITVLSVMNGFQEEIRKKIIGVTSHMQITSTSSSVNNWQNIANIVQSNKHVLAIAPYVDGQALISYENNVSGVMVRGIDTTLEKNVESIQNQIIYGRYSSLDAKEFNVILGYELARTLGVFVGDQITLITPNGQITPGGLIPRFKRFTVTAIFNTHMYEYDSSLILISLTNAQKLFKLGKDVSGVRLKVDDVMITQTIKEDLINKMPDNIIITDWIDQHKNYFAAVKLEKKMMFIILTLIIAVAAFNLVSTLVMTVNDKRSDIAILRTMGATKSSIMKIFILQGGISGIIGTSLGAVIGVVLSINVGHIVHGLESLFGMKLINGDVYLLDYLPSKIIPRDVIEIVIVSILLSIIATIYPSRNAAKTNPAEALRDE